MAGNREQVGELYTKITVEGATGAKQELRGVQQEFKNTEHAARQAIGAEGSGGVAGFSARMRDATKPLRQFSEAIRGTISAVLGWSGAIGLVTAAIGGLIAGLERAMNAMSGLDKASKANTEALRAEADVLDQLAERLKKADITPKPSTEGIDKANEKIKELDKEISNLETRATPLLTKLFGPLAGLFIESRTTANARAEREKAKELFDRIIEDEQRAISASMTVRRAAHEDVMRMLEEEHDARVKAASVGPTRDTFMDALNAQEDLSRVAKTMGDEMVKAWQKVKEEQKEIIQEMVKGVRALQAEQNATFNRTLEGIAANVSALKTTISLRSRSVN